MIQEILEPGIEPEEIKGAPGEEREKSEEKIENRDAPASGLTAPITPLEQKNRPVEGDFAEKEQERTIAKKERFIKGIIESDKCSTITKACNYAGINRDTYYEWIKKDIDFKKNVSKAYDEWLEIKKKEIDEEIKAERAWW